MSSDSTITTPSPSAAQQPVKPVTERALIRRINRVLAREGKVLRVCRRDSGWFRDLGRYYQVDQNNNICGPTWVTTRADLEAYAREIGALGPSESLNPEVYL
jgi:hypothetical protein